MKTALFFFTILFIGVTSLGQTSNGGNPDNLQLNTIATAVPFLRIAPDARSAGMGDVGLATSEDTYSLHWNTAKMAFSDRKFEMGYSYSPWLRNLIDGLHYHHLSGYGKLGSRHTVGASITYFDVGEIQIFNAQGQLIKEISPNEFQFVGGYAFQLSRRSAIGVNLKYIYSDLTNGFSSGTVSTHPGTSGAADLSYSYRNERINWWNKSFTWAFGTTVANLGNKMSYTSEGNRDFLPTNLGLGTSLKMNFNNCHALTAAVDFNKLLVPTAPIRDGNGAILSGYDSNVGAVLGIVQSFYDAPGNISSGPGGTVIVEKGSRLKEELNEVTIGGGLEYQAANLGSVRAGYFHEHSTKGDRKYFTFGLGVSRSFFGIDVSYLAALRRTNPLANTLRFSLNFKIG